MRDIAKATVQFRMYIYIYIRETTQKQNHVGPPEILLQIR